MTQEEIDCYLKTSIEAHEAGEPTVCFIYHTFACDCEPRCRSHRWQPMEIAG